VGSLKKLPSSDVTWVNVDASTNHCLRTSLQGYRYEIVHATRGDEPARMIANVTGPTCTIDLIAEKRPLQTVQPGDLLAVLDVGGYAEVLANQFNLIPRPASVLVCGDRVDVVRRRETLTDLFTAQVVPARLM
jgi:diaminopimelate decarboxylase